MSNQQLEMMNDSFSLHPNEGDTNKVQIDNNEFVVINKDDMLVSGQNTPILTDTLRMAPD